MTSEKPNPGMSRKMLFTIITPVIITLLTTAVFTPLGDRLRSAIFPFKAIVQGKIIKNKKPVPELIVRLDEMFESETTRDGKYVFEEVVEGVHEMRILDKKKNIELYTTRIIVTPDVKHKKIEDIEVDGAKFTVEHDGQTSEFTASLDKKTQTTGHGNPMMETDMVEREAGPAGAAGKTDNSGQLHTDGMPGQSQVPASAFERTEEYLEAYHEVLAFNENFQMFNAEIWIEADRYTYEDIDFVVYHLDEYYSPSVVSRYNKNEDFVLNLLVSYDFDYSVVVYYKDGSYDIIDARFHFNE